MNVDEGFLLVGLAPEYQRRGRWCVGFKSTDDLKLLPKLALQFVSQKLERLARAVFRKRRNAAVKGVTQELAAKLAAFVRRLGEGCFQAASRLRRKADVGREAAVELQLNERQLRPDRRPKAAVPLTTNIDWTSPTDRALVIS